MYPIDDTSRTHRRGRFSTGCTRGSSSIGRTPDDGTPAEPAPILEPITAIDLDELTATTAGTQTNE